MFNYKKLQLTLNKAIAERNKIHIIKKLEEYYKTVNYKEQIKAKEYAILMYWRAKKQGRIDNLNRIVKI